MNIHFEGLTLQNFKSFNGRHTIALAGGGLVYVAGKNEVDPELGANGVGKSTLFDAMLWTLYGKTGRDNRPGSSIEPWDGDCDTKVGLHLSINDKGMTIARRRNPNGLTVHYAGRSTTPVTITQDEIDRILGMTESMFRCSVILSQSSALFLDLRAEAQSQMFTDALNLDQWLDAAKRAHDEKKTLAAKLEGLKFVQAKAGGRLDEIKRQMQEERLAAKDFDRDLKERLSEKEYLLHSMTKELEALPDAAAIIKKHEANLDIYTKARTKIEVQYQTMLNTISTLQAEMTLLRKPLRTDKPVCPECGQQVSVNHLTQKLAALDHDFRKTVKDKDLLHKELTHHDSLVQNKRVEINQQQVILNKRLVLENNIKVQKGMLETLAKTKNLHRQKADALKVSFNEVTASLDQTQADIDAQTQAMGMAEYWSGAFKEIRLELIDQVLAELGLAATRHAEALGLSGWQIAFTTERESKGGTTAGFQVLLCPAGQNEAIRFEAYSGGESQRLQLAISFALSEIVLARAGVEINMEALDEPTRGLSPEGVEALLEHLRERAHALKRTCFVVEHHSLERGAFDKTLIVRKTAQGSTLREV